MGHRARGAALRKMRALSRRSDAIRCLAAALLGTGGMASFKRFLVGVDFEPPSLAALDWAIELASQVGASITVLHTYEIPIVGIPDGAFIASAEYASKLMSAADEALAAAIGARQGRGVELTRLMRQGVAWETIHQAADEIDADLIVVGTHGRKGISHALLGSVAEKTIRTARRPVVVVRPTAR
jgi:nucleotide-binding universal stress UspA family protein